MRCNTPERGGRALCSILQIVAVCCSVLQCVAVFCCVLQCVAAHLSAAEERFAILVIKLNNSIGVVYGLCPHLQFQKDLYIYPYKCTNQYDMYTCENMHVYICISIYIYLNPKCVYIRVNTYMYIYIYIYIHKCCIHIYICISVYIYLDP